MASDGKRHLPMLPKAEVAAEEEDDRPPWHWAAIGAVAVFVLWLPLAAALHGLLGNAAGVAAGVVNAGGFALACFGSGFLVGRYGGRAGKREATAGAAAASALACLIAALQLRGGVLTWVVILAIFVGIGAGSARLGGALGLARRAPGAGTQKP
jgi:tRNA-(ms[2]io[6]A)-hydroxylase